MSRAFRENACLGISQSLAFTIRHHVLRDTADFDNSEVKPDQGKNPLLYQLFDMSQEIQWCSTTVKSNVQIQCIVLTVCR